MLLTGSPSFAPGSLPGFATSLFCHGWRSWNANQSTRQAILDLLAQQNIELNCLTGMILQHGIEVKGFTF
jgi:hypothetical protein